MEKIMPDGVSLEAFQMKQKRKHVKVQESVMVRIEPHMKQIEELVALCYAESRSKGYDFGHLVTKQLSAMIER